MSDWDIIEGGRAELELELLKAMFTPGAESRAHELKTHLVPRGQGKLRLVSDQTREHTSFETDANPEASKD